MGISPPCPWGSPWAAGFSWALWWTLLFCTPWGSSPLSMWGSPWAAEGLLGCLSAGCLVLYCWGWISLVVQVLLIVNPSPCLWLISCLKWNLKHLLVPCHNVTFLALTQLSKVLKEIDLLFVSSMVLKEGMPYRPHVPVAWKEAFFPPHLPMGYLKEVSLPLFLTVSLTLLASSFSLMTLMLSITGVFIGTNLRLFCSFLPCVLAGVLKGVSVHAFLMTHMPSTPRVLKGSQLCIYFAYFYLMCGLGSWKDSQCMSLQWLLCHLHQGSWNVINLYCSLLPCVFLAGVLKGVSVHIHIAMVLKELGGWSWKDFDATLWFLHCVLPSIFKQWSWKESLELVFVLFPIAETDLETFLHITWMRPSLELAACLTMMSLHVLGLYNIKRMVLK